MLDAMGVRVVADMTRKQIIIWLVELAKQQVHRATVTYYNMPA